MKALLRPFCAWFTVAATVSSAQPARQIITARSFSGQFTAQEIRGRLLWSPSPVAARVSLAGTSAFLMTAPPVSATAELDKIPLEPALLVVSCERIKELFLMELGLKDEWRGKIALIINSSLPKEQGPSLTAFYRPSGWSYQLELPKTIQPDTLVRGVVQTLLEELVNRRTGSQSTEVPFWLIEGLCAHLQAYNLPTFIIRPNVQSAGYVNLRVEGLDGVRATLRQRAPLTFQQLSWPEQSNVAGKDEAVYRCCAQLLFEGLLHLNDGPSCLRQMLQEMPKHLNWQTAFLQSFHSHFARLLDVEKWWGLNCVGFTESALPNTGTEQECWHKLQDALDVPVEVQLDPSRQPTAARLTLQEVILQWNAADALPALQRAVRDLEGLQFSTFQHDWNLNVADASRDMRRKMSDADALQRRIGQELSPLIARYATTLLSYVKQSHYAATVALPGKFHASDLLALKKDTERQLNSLDQERAAMRAKFASTASAPGPKFTP